jgi:hypothetical protein
LDWWICLCGYTEREEICIGGRVPFSASLNIYSAASRPWPSLFGWEDSVPLQLPSWDHWVALDLLQPSPVFCLITVFPPASPGKHLFCKSSLQTVLN